MLALFILKSVLCPVYREGDKIHNFFNVTVTLENVHWLAHSNEKWANESGSAQLVEQLVCNVP